MSTEAEWMLIEPEENPRAVLLKQRDHYGFKGI